MRRTAKRLVLALIFPLVLLAQGSSLRSPDVIYAPTPQRVVERMLKLAKVGPGDVVYDLGSGDGRIVITAAKQFGARGVGIEINPKLVEAARAKARAAGVEDRVEFRNEDMFEADIREATVVTTYLLRRLNEKLRPKLWKELRPGTRIVTHSYHMGYDWPADKQVELVGSRIFLWTVK